MGSPSMLRVSLPPSLSAPSSSSEARESVDESSDSRTPAPASRSRMSRLAWLRSAGAGADAPFGPGAPAAAASAPGGGRRAPRSLAGLADTLRLSLASSTSLGRSGR